MTRAWRLVTWDCLLLYLLFWMMYFCGFYTTAGIIAMATLPCLSFAAYALGRNNWIALGCIAVFFLCHLTFAIVNFC